MASFTMRLSHLIISPCQLKADRATRVALFPCKDSEPVEKEKKLVEGGTAKGTKRLRVLQILGRAAEKVKESFSPKQKGDWKDVMLMSVSFAVYVYMSQQIVCAYCVWMSMLGQ